MCGPLTPAGTLKMAKIEGKIYISQEREVKKFRNRCPPIRYNALLLYLKYEIAKF